MRLLYFPGPGDIVNTYKLWRDGKDDPYQQAVTYSSQFFEACHEFDAEVIAFSRHGNAGEIKEGRFTIKDKSAFLQGKGGILFFVGYLVRGIYIVYSSIRYKADCVFVADGNTFWFILSILSLFGKKVVPLMHCTLWPRTRKPTKVNQHLLRWAAPFFRKHAFACMTVSNDITQQVEHVCARKFSPHKSHSPIVEFIPSYRDIYPDLGFNEHSVRPFRVLFPSRIEANKGVFVLLELARKCKEEGLDILFDVAGDGADLEEFKRQVKASELSKFIECHGYCYREKMRELVKVSHVFLVATTDKFVEGFNKVCAESALSNRPLIASTVCPALSYVSDISIAVEPGDTEAYFRAISQLYSDEKMYAEKSGAAGKLKPLFLSDTYSYKSAVKKIIHAARDGERPSDRRVMGMAFQEI